jgi:predicted acyltransferase (DUF342 family)
MGQQVFINFDVENLKNARCRAADDLRLKKFPQLVAGDSTVYDVFLTGSSGLLNIQDYTAVRMGIGNLNQRPDSGNYTIAGTQTLAYNHSASDLETAIEAITGNACTVTELTGFVYKITFDAVGAQTVPSIDSSDLVPASSVSATVLTQGDSTTQEQWLWRLFRNALAFTDSFTNITGQGIQATLSLATPGIYDLLAEGTTKSTNFEIEVTDSTGNVQTIAQIPITLNGEVIGTGFEGTVPSARSLDPAATAFLNSFPNPEIEGNLTVEGDLEAKSDAIVTDSLKVDTDTLVVDASSNMVGINKDNPDVALDVIGDIDVTGEVDANSVQANTYYGGTGAFANTSVSGDLTVSGDATVSGDVTFSGGADIDGDLTVDNITSDQTIEATALKSNTADIGIMDVDNVDVEFENSDGSVMLHVNPAGDGVILKTANKAFVKHNCYNKTGSVRLQKAASASEEILLRYEGENSNNFVIQQWHGGTQEGQIKFLGDTPSASNTVRLDAKNVDLGFSNTVLTKIFSDTNFGANKKLVFVDSRDTTDGIHFEHSGAGATFQIGRFGSYGDSDYGVFKITNTNPTFGTSSVLEVDRYNQTAVLNSAQVGIGKTPSGTGVSLDVNNGIKSGGFVQVGSFNGSGNFPTAPAGAIIFDSSNGTFKGFDGSSWTELG